MSANKIKVLCVDDSALIRSVMTEIINSQPDMTVVGTAADPLVARDLIKVTNPDVLTLDVEMPRMDGLEFLEKLMRLRPMPVVMVSSLTERGSEIALRALELGAIDFVTKPRLGVRDGLLNYTELIAGKIRTAFGARLLPSRSNAAAKSSANAPPEALLRSPLLSTEKLIIIGASTGGTEAIREVLHPLPPDCPAVLIAQHMPAGFTKSFAQRLDGLCRITVKEAEHGERVLPGYAYIAPGAFHLSLARSGANYVAHLDQEPPVNRHRPSIDVLFDSAARHAGKNAIGMILTGMGKDGAEGLLRMKKAGAFTLAQDEASCVVFGMPKEAIALGAADEVAPLGEMSRRVLAHLRTFGARTNRV
ncbi:chemotaxis response regulator protein-glutamate methylesterase [Variovorax sp. J22P240]|uniref:protein-glutamate methylesterase/protein-glutamine glutaminase n=1 Tax=unclassified Variovorax TaxID=663243 RepID=UPI002577A020|nr:MULTISPECIES: chemotaxis response regulator protein-glutamate methylesterase [unclassified Variovorax]MDM0002170.1 chemotaxis response regulator protein-glutamate methylesterase [Variovorax sp. J22P240]MDM0052381.1 chemotaxis response regulator protein-glutamate methylesterase [Variovorax sp. J22R115]